MLIYDSCFAKALILKKLSEHKGLEKTKIIEIDETQVSQQNTLKLVSSIPSTLSPIL